VFRPTAIRDTWYGIALPRSRLLARVAGTLFQSHHFRVARLASIRWYSRSVLIDPEGSLNAGVSSRKDSSAPDLGEQLHKIGDRSCIELLYNVDDLVSKIFIGESLTQPVELLDRAVPRHRIVQPSLVAVLLLHKDTLVFGAKS
jgi:hypothetical protein